jgi:hypothetical protein
MQNLLLEEMRYRGWAKVDHRVSSETVDWLKDELLNRMSMLIEKHGRDCLEQWQHLDIVKCMFSFDDKWRELISSKWLNDLVNLLLNDKAVIYDVFGLLNIDTAVHKRGKFHRDQLFLGNLRSSILVVIPLVDFTPEVGPTEVVTGSHLIEQRPSDEYLQKHSTQLLGKAGEVFVVNAATWHRGGDNQNGKPRPAIIIRYQLPFLKRTIDLCQVYRDELETETSELIKQRLGWHCREATQFADLLTDDSMFRPGQYDTRGLYEC